MMMMMMMIIIIIIIITGPGNSQKAHPSGSVVPLIVDPNTNVEHGQPRPL